MIERAKTLEVPGRLTFELVDMTSWEPRDPIDLILSNAALQWIPDQESLLEKMASWLSPSGNMAFQVPANFDEPSHMLIDSVVQSPKWLSVLGRDLPKPKILGSAKEYLALLAELGLLTAAWETTYLHVLHGGDAVLEWTKGTTLRPVLEALSPGLQSEFLDEYAKLLSDAYPPSSIGTVFPFRRIFVVGSNVDENPLAPVAALDHVQVAMPKGGESEARYFFTGILGLREIEKPDDLKSRGGCWFGGDGFQVHLGVEENFTPAKTSHIALRVTDLENIVALLRDKGHHVQDLQSRGLERFCCTTDSFGNRIELIQT